MIKRVILMALTFALISISNWSWSRLFGCGCWLWCCGWGWCCGWFWRCGWCWRCGWRWRCGWCWCCGWFWRCGHWNNSGIDWNDFVLQCLYDLWWELCAQLWAFCFQYTDAFVVSQVVLWAVASFTCVFNAFVWSLLELSSWERARSRTDWFIEVSFIGTTWSLCICLTRIPINACYKSITSAGL